VAANIAHSVEAAAAFNNGAQSVGLFRTEMLYMDRPGAPSEDELYNIFARRWNRRRAQHYYSHHGYRRR
jgi:fructose-specific PTS system IIA-like component